MSHFNKTNKLFLVLACFFLADAIISEFMGVKLFSVEETLGMAKFNIDLFGVKDLTFVMSAGVITWPVIFVLTDIINEYFGLKGIRFLSYLTAIILIYSFIIAGLDIKLKPADFWIKQNINGQDINMNTAFTGIFGQGMWIIVGSITAFLVGQVTDTFIFHKIKKITGDKQLWLRATGSTLISQLIDSFIVIFIAFYLNPQYHYSWQMVAAIGLVGYTYKFILALLMTPILYGVHYIIDSYLGKDLAHQLMDNAAKEE
jgi:uncharacterized integral membrane protein (TIGR00697 family)